MGKRKLIPTICPYCGVGCSFYIEVEHGKAVNIEYMTDHPVCNGRLCSKGNASIEILNHPDRLTHPLKKVNGTFQQISWDEALDTVADKLKATIKEHSPYSLGFLASAKCTNEENYLFQKMVRMLGTNNVDHCARL
jgi:formate dehydrogenase major subunit